MQVQIEQLENQNVVNFYVEGLVDESALLFDEYSTKLPDFVKNILEKTKRIKRTWFKKVL